jgi:hypothetical protein
MDVPKNYFILTQSDQLTEMEFNKKIFYLANDLENLNLLDTYDGITKISDNLVIEPNQIFGIAEYGITKEASLNTLEHLTQEHPQAIIASCVF